VLDELVDLFLGGLARFAPLDQGYRFCSFKLSSNG
jgi:hypothetical protein